MFGFAKAKKAMQWLHSLEPKPSAVIRQELACRTSCIPPQTHFTSIPPLDHSQLQVFGYGSGRATGCRPIAATWFIVIVAVGTTNLFPAYGHGQTKNRSACAQRRNSTNIVRGLTKVVHDRQFP